METITEQMDAGEVGSISDIPERKHRRRARYWAAAAASTFGYAEKVFLRLMM